MIRLLLVFIIGLVVNSTPLSLTDIYEKIAQHLREGNSKAITEYFDTTLELTIADRESVYNKVQAEIILKNFFVKNQPKAFQIIHRGASGEGAKYAIGSLVTQNGTFRTYFFLKLKGTNYVIQELRFEQE